MSDLDAAIQEALEQVRAERSQSIVLRRGETTLTAQSFRVERLSKAAQYRSEGGKERRSDMVLLGAVDADIAIDDRFNDENGRLCQVNFIQPNRSVATMAEAVIIG